MIRGQRLAVLLLAFGLVLLPFAARAQKADLAPAPHDAVYGYYCTYCQYQTGGHIQRYTVKQIADSGQAGEMTALYYAFGRVENNRCELWWPSIETDQFYTAQQSVSGVADEEGPGHLRGIFHQLQELKQRFPHLKVVMSLGGGSLSSGFPSAAEPRNIKAFVHSCVQKFIAGHIAPGIEAPGLFDGIDLDWEMPVTGNNFNGHRTPGRPEDTQNYVALAREFRAQMDAIRPGLLLTAALPAGEHNLQYYDLKGMSLYMNDMAIMGYDMAGRNDHVTSFSSPLYPDPAYPAKKNSNDAFAVTYLEARGVPPEKVLLGVPFGDGRHWVNVPHVNHGLYQPASPAPAVVNNASNAMRQDPWLALPATADFQYWDKIGSCTAWDQGNFYTYDCPQAMSAKTAYARSHHLGGVMFWEITADPSGHLLQALSGRGAEAENQKAH